MKRFASVFFLGVVGCAGNSPPAPSVFLPAEGVAATDFVVVNICRPKLGFFKVDSSSAHLEGGLAINNEELRPITSARAYKINLPKRGSYEVVFSPPRPPHDYGSGKTLNLRLDPKTRVHHLIIDAEASDSAAGRILSGILMGGSNTRWSIKRVPETEFQKSCTDVKFQTFTHREIAR
jgi:hypothetical protein